jgi:uncharacterized protein YqeY
MVVAVATDSLEYLESLEPPGPAAPLRQRLRDALGVAIKERDRVAAGALRSALAAIENAEAVEPGPDADRGLGIGQIPVGVGAAEAARRELTERDVERIVRAEITEREAAAHGYELAGRSSHASRLRLEIDVLSRHLGAS